MSQTKLSACVIGGGVGGLLSMDALALSERFELVAAADLRPEVRAQLEQTFPGLRTFASYQELFAACPTDVVCVSTYSASHEDIVLAALALPLKGILVEKPLAHTFESGRRLLEAIRQRDLPMVVPHGLLVSETPLEVIARVQNGEIGSLKLVEIQNVKWDISNAGVHWLNFFITLTGGEPLASVLAICDTSTRTYRDGLQVETVAVTYAQTQSGIRVVMNTGDDVKVNHPGKEMLFRIVGTAGQIEFWGWEQGYHLLNNEFPRGQLIMPYVKSTSFHQRYLEQLAEMIEQGRCDYTIPESSLQALELCEGAYLSSRHRCRVTFPLASFTPPSASSWDPGMPYTGSGGGRDGRKL